MQHQNTFIGLISGILGGLGKYFIQIQTPFILNLTGAIITAMLCGAAGVAGKEGILWLKKTIQKRNADRITKQA